MWYQIWKQTTFLERDCLWNERMKVAASRCLICCGKNMLENKGRGCKGDYGHCVPLFSFTNIDAWEENKVCSTPFTGNVPSSLPPHSVVWSITEEWIKPITEPEVHLQTALFIKETELKVGVKLKESNTFYLEFCISVLIRVSQTWIILDYLIRKAKRLEQGFSLTYQKSVFDWSEGWWRQRYYVDVPQKHLTWTWSCSPFGIVIMKRHTLWRDVWNVAVLFHHLHF